MARFWRHADPGRGRKFQRVYNFYLQHACHDFDRDQSNDSKERRPASSMNHDQIALRAICIAAFPHDVLQGIGRTNCGEERS